MGELFLAEPPRMVDSVIAPAPITKENIAALTGVRACAPAWVVIHHFELHWMMLFPGLVFLQPLTRAAGLGVDVFFVLSGFILTHNYLRQFHRVDRQGYFHFLGMRLARLYPVHLFALLTLLAGLIIGKLAHLHFNTPGRMGAWDFVCNVLLVHAWGWVGHLSWNAPAWSISAEWFAYLFFPFLAMRLTRVRKPAVALASAMGLVAVLMFVFAFVGSLTLVRVSCEFSAGCFLYRVYQDRWLRSLRWSWIAPAIVVTVIAILYAAHGLGSLHAGEYLPLPLMALFVLALASSRSGLSGMLGTRFFVFWGEVSYSLYMTHDVVRMFLTKLLPIEFWMHRSALMRALGLVVYAGAVGFVAAATYYLIETPGRRTLRRVTDRCFPPVARESIPSEPPRRRAA